MENFETNLVANKIFQCFYTRAIVENVSKAGIVEFCSFKEDMSVFSRNKLTLFEAVRKEYVCFFVLRINRVQLVSKKSVSW